MPRSTTPIAKWARRTPEPHLVSEQPVPGNDDRNLARVRWVLDIVVDTRSDELVRLSELEGEVLAQLCVCNQTNRHEDENRSEERYGVAVPFEQGCVEEGWIVETDVRVVVWSNEDEQQVEQSLRRRCRPESVGEESSRYPFACGPCRLAPRLVRGEE